MSSIQEIAKEVAGIDEKIEQAMPFIFGMLKFTPIGAEASIAQPLVMALLGAVDDGAKAIAAGDTKSAIDVLAALMKHVLPGMPNSPALTPHPRPDAAPMQAG